jgi:hydrogenase nickel incorporation protein HypA/HybF
LETLEETRMHELPATRAILDLVLTAAGPAPAGRIVAVHVVIGELSGYSGEPIHQYFEVLSRGTAAAGAELRFRAEPAEGRCGDCGVCFDIGPPLPWRCECGSSSLRVSGGDAFYVSHIEVEEA